jgi:hypothetical protein
MPEPTYAEFFKTAELVTKSLATHAEELSHLEVSRLKFDALFTQVKELSAEQADLTAKKQEVSKRLAALVLDGRELLTFLKVGVKQHFGKRAEKLVAFGMQPFRSRPRLKVVGPDGEPLKRRPTQEEPPAQSPNP